MEKLLKNWGNSGIPGKLLAKLQMTALMSTISSENGRRSRKIHDKQTNLSWSRYNGFISVHSHIRPLKHKKYSVLLDRACHRGKSPALCDIFVYHQWYLPQFRNPSLETLVSSMSLSCPKYICQLTLMGNSACLSATLRGTFRVH